MKNSYIAQLIVDNKIIDTTTIHQDDQKLATQLFYEFGHREILESDNYRIDIFKEENI